MSKRSDKLKQMLEELGHKNVKIWFEPWQRAFEMCGIDGGWFSESDQRNVEPLGLSYNEALNHIKVASWLRIKENIK